MSVQISYLQIVLNEIKEVRGTVLKQGCQCGPQEEGVLTSAEQTPSWPLDFTAWKSLVALRRTIWCEVRLEGWIMNSLLVERENARTPKPDPTPIQTNKYSFLSFIEGE